MVPGALGHVFQRPWCNIPAGHGILMLMGGFLHPGVRKERGKHREHGMTSCRSSGFSQVALGFPSVLRAFLPRAFSEGPQLGVLMQQGWWVRQQEMQAPSVSLSGLLIPCGCGFAVQVTKPRLVYVSQGFWHPSAVNWMPLSENGRSGKGEGVVKNFCLWRLSLALLRSMSVAGRVSWGTGTCPGAPLSIHCCSWARLRLPAQVSHSPEQWAALASREGD